MTINTDNIIWQGHASFLIRSSQTIYIDPWEVSGPPADIICISHDHFDHLDLPTIKNLITPKTQIFTTQTVAEQLQDYAAQVTVMRSGDEATKDSVQIKAVAAYNLDKDFHPKELGHLGFIISVDGLSIYHTGDTDFIPEMANYHAQVALIPVSGTYVSTAAEAVQAALAIKPEVAIPMHYGKIVGDVAMAEEFAASLKGQIPVTIKSANKNV